MIAPCIERPPLHYGEGGQVYKKEGNNTQMSV